MSDATSNSLLTLGRRRGEGQAFRQMFQRHDGRLSKGDLLRSQLFKDRRQQLRVYLRPALAPRIRNLETWSSKYSMLAICPCRRVALKVNALSRGLSTTKTSFKLCMMRSRADPKYSRARSQGLRNWTLRVALETLKMT